MVIRGGGNLHDYFMSTIIFTLTMNKIFIYNTPKTIRKVATVLIWICKPSCTIRIFQDLGEVG